MCGLVLAMGKTMLSQSEIGIFKNMLAFDQLRGEHSTGLFALFRPHGKAPFYKVNKECLEGVDFVRSPLFVNTVGHVSQMAGGIKSTEWAKAMFGHNRYATMGAVNAKNAHPFTHGHITLAHNGTLRNQSLLPDSNKFQVDSENICYSISTIGVEETVKRLHGAFALIWFNAEDMTINLLRNDEREFHVFETTTGDWFGCSEEKMGDWLLTRGRTGKKIKRHFETTPGVQYIFDVSKGCELKEERKHELPVFHSYSSYPTRKTLEEEEKQYNAWFEPRKRRNEASTATGKGTPNSKEATSPSSRVSGLFEKYNLDLEIGSQMEFEMYSYDAYITREGEKQETGQIIGWLGDAAEEYIEIQCHSVKESDFQVDTKGYGTIIGVFERNDCLHIILRPNQAGVGVPFPVIEPNKDLPAIVHRKPGVDCNGKFIDQATWDIMSRGGCPTCGHVFKWDTEAHLAESLAGYLMCANEDDCNRRVVKLEAALALPQDKKPETNPVINAGTTANGKTFTRKEWEKNCKCAVCDKKFEYSEAHQVRAYHGYVVCVNDKECESRCETFEELSDKEAAAKARIDTSGDDEGFQFLDEIHDGFGDDEPEDLMVTATGETFTATEWRRSPNNTCAGCGNPIPFDDVPDAKILHGSYCFCGDCVESLEDDDKPKVTYVRADNKLKKEEKEGVDKKFCTACGVHHGSDVLYGNLTYEKFLELDEKCYWRAHYRGKFRTQILEDVNKKSPKKKVSPQKFVEDSAGMWCDVCETTHNQYMTTGNMDHRSWNFLPVNCPIKIKFKDKFAPAPKNNVTEIKSRQILSV
ncbi:MAG: class II glutamine amidotransferase, partial [Plesiomonas sp.]